MRTSVTRRFARSLMTGFASRTKVIYFVATMILPSLASTLGAFVLLHILVCPVTSNDGSATVTIDSDGSALLNEEESDDCLLVSMSSLSLDGESKHPLEGISFSVHRNGEPETCGNVTSNLSVMQEVLDSLEDRCDDLDKYNIESFLTEVFARQLSSNQCGSTDNETAPEGLYGFCDMGPERTPILYDHGSLVRVTGGSLPCRFYTREGVRVSSLKDLTKLTLEAKEKARSSCNSSDVTCEQAAIPEVHLYAVPAGRVFMFAPSFVGEIFDLSHVVNDKGLPISLEVLSLNPRVFGFTNFFSKEEADDLVQRALTETSEELRLKRSTTGASNQKQVFSKRTSENAFDVSGKTSINVKQRCFKTLGFDEYWEGHADGLQVLRYNESKAYIPHMDYLNDPGEVDPYNYESARKGGNRFATILLYMNDMSEHDGGETVFSEAWPPSLPQEKQVPILQAIDELRASGDANVVEQDTWEEEMVATCRTRLAVRPNLSRAVLFYSQHPNGEPDKMSKHGGCPVLKGAKWAANLWVWNAPRVGYAGAPMKPNQNSERKFKQLSASFRNSGNDPAFREAELYYEDQFWGKFGHGDPTLPVNTFEGHVWNVKVGGETVKTFVISDAEEQVYVV